MEEGLMNPVRSTEGRRPEASHPDRGEAGETGARRAGSFREVLEGLVGQKVVLADPQSLQEGPVGHALRIKIAPARVVHCAEDGICVVRLFTHRNPKKRGDEPMQQWIPFSAVKGMSLREGEVVLHL